MDASLNIPTQVVEAFCKRWGVRELAIFGSAARGELGPESDVDVMLDFHSGFGFTFENTPDIIDELRTMFGRPVDVLERNRIRNRFRERTIMAEHKVLYAA